MAELVHQEVAEVAVDRTAAGAEHDRGVAVARPQGTRARVRRLISGNGAGR